MTVVTRFAPSPTGFLHIGGARTALFNWLYARRHGGTYLLRIEDTDRQRSTKEAIDAILDGLSWLGLNWDGDVVYQFSRAARHAEVARQLLADGKAYHCYASPAELDEMREAARREGRPMRYDGRWRDRDPRDAPPGVKPVIRLKAPQDGETTVIDRVLGPVTVQNAQLDDMVLLRSDGTPVYMLSVVVDDHDMGVTHVIRGADHHTNSFRQTQLYNALGWSVPAFAHLPLIHGADGAKLSKRHGALGVDAYRDMGFLPEALRNYLLRLGWSHGDDEIIPTAKAIEWFDLEHVGPSPARFDLAKLTNLNAHYLRETPDADLLPLVKPAIEAATGAPLDGIGLDRVRRGLAGVKQRSRTLVELAAGLAFYARDRVSPADEKAAAIMTGDARALLAGIAGALESADWRESALETAVKTFAEGAGVKLGQVAQPLRVALTGSTVSPGIFEVLAILGREQALARLRQAAQPTA
jgi:glutamyl-tRNA synthetase